MRRIILRPFFHLHQPFFPFYHRTAPQWQLKIKNNQPQYETNEANKPNDPHHVFEQFFKEHEPKTEQQKEFFKKHYPQKIQETYDPFKVLEINKNASVQEIKQAYRKLALKNHPKNNTTPQASAKFSEIAKAYQNIMQSKRSRDFGELGINSFFQDFDRQIDEIFNVNKNKGAKQTVAGKQNQNKKPNYGQLYSESSHYETVNGKQTKYVIEKNYKKDGQLLNVKREQRLKDDGKIQITQIIDNGKQVKKKTYIQEKDTKQIS